MDGSISFAGLLNGSIAEGGGGGSTVEITPVVTSGTKIADVSVNGVEKDLYCPTPPTPQEVIITPVVTTGTKIADVSVNGVEKDLYCPTPPTPTEVEVTQIQTSGTKIANIEVNNVNTDIFAPEGGEIIYSLTERKIGKFLDADLFDIIIDLGSELSFTTDWNVVIQHQNKYSIIFDGILISTTKLSYPVNIAANDPTNIEIAPSRPAVGRYLYFKYTKNS